MGQRAPQRAGSARAALAVSVYRPTASFPQSERFGLTAQMRRSAVAVGSNIAEGCGRQGNGEFLHSLTLARGEASEHDFQADLAGDLAFAEPDAAKTASTPSTMFSAC